MKLDSRNKSRRDKTIHSKSFETQGGKRNRPEGSKRIERLSHFMDRGMDQVRL